MLCVFCAAKISLSDHMQIASVSSQDSSELHYFTRFQNDAGKVYITINQPKTPLKFTNSVMVANETICI